MADGCGVKLEILSRSASETETLGAALGALLRPGDIVCLAGDLGAGKTVFSRGIGRGFGASPPLTSPTYNLAHAHQRASDRTPLYHIDLYRVSGPAEAATIGLDDMLDGAGVVIIEWSERLCDSLPRDRLWIEIDLIDAHSRTLSLAAQGERHAALLQSLSARADKHK